MRGEAETGVGWHFSASHRDPTNGQLHGHTWEVVAWWPAEPWRDARVLQETLDSGLQPVNPVYAWGTGKDFELVFDKCLTALMNDPDTGLGMFVADLSEESVRMATRYATLDANAVRLTKIAINRSYGAMGLDGALRQALELDVEIETTDTEESRTFKALLSQHGVKAAIAWREARFASASPGTATSQ